MKKLLLILIILSSCSKMNKEGKITIRKNNHYSFDYSLRVSGNKMSYEFTFSESCMYENLKDGCNDLNKLFGIAGIQHHHKNSARWAWKCYNNQLTVTNYTYNNGNLTKNTKLIEIFPNKSYIFTIEIIDKKAYYYFNNDLMCVDECNIEGILRALYPYFGGDCKAPHDILLYFKEL